MTAKKLGIWMDHSNAHLIEFTRDAEDATNIVSKFTHEEKEHSLGKSENLMHNKEQHQQSKFYKQLGEAIRKYEDVILFGPTNAKEELFNLLKADHHFAKIRMEVKQTDKLTEKQQHDFVMEYFSRHKN